MLVNNDELIKYFPELLLVWEYNGLSYYNLKSPIIRKDISNSIGPFQLRKMRDEYYGNGDLINIIFLEKANFAFSLTLNVDNDKQIYNGLLTLPHDMLSIDSCIILFNQNIDVRYVTKCGSYKYYDKQQILRENTINHIVK